MKSSARCVRPSTVFGLALILMAAARSQTPGTALVRHAPQLGGTLEGSVQQMLAESTALPGGTVVTGDLLVPGTPAVRLNGRPHYLGTIDGPGAPTPTSHTITLNGGAALRHVIRRTEPRMLAAVALPPPPPGSRAVKITAPLPTPVNFATLRDLELAGRAGALAVPAGAYGEFVAEGNSAFILGVPGATQPAHYAFQQLALKGDKALMIAGPVIVTVGEVEAAGTIGRADHPEWLTLRIAKGGLSLQGNDLAHAFVEAPAGTVSLAGHARLVGGVMCDRLVMNGNAVLRLVETAGPNQPPLVTLASPAEGTLFTAPASILLAAVASDSDGTVDRVEFFQGATKLGESVRVPFEVRWSGVPPGAYALSARAVDNRGATTTSTPRQVVVQVGLPYFTSFEAADGYTVGGLAGQVGWSTTGVVSVAEAPAFRGTRALSVGGAVGGGEATHGFPSYAGESVALVDFWARPAAASGPEAGSFVRTDASRVALAGSGGVGELYVFDGDGVGAGRWQATGSKVTLGSDLRPATWLRVTVREDFATHRWDLYVNGSMIAAGLGFADGTANRLARITLAGGQGREGGFDDLYAGFEHPLFADVDRDGLDDAWEIQNGLSLTANDRAGDADGDGLSNLREFQLGLRANAADSDGDGLPDAWEVRYGLNPLAPDANTDPDGDGVSNLREYQLGRNPTKGALPDPTGVVNLRLFSPLP